MRSFEYYDLIDSLDLYIQLFESAIERKIDDKELRAQVISSAIVKYSKDLARLNGHKLQQYFALLKEASIDQVDYLKLKLDIENQLGREKEATQTYSELLDQGIAREFR